MKLTEIRIKALSEIYELKKKLKNIETFDLEKKEILKVYCLVVKAFKRTKLIFELECLCQDMILAEGSVRNLAVEMYKIHDKLKMKYKTF